MKCQALFSLKSTEKIKRPSAVVLTGTLRVSKEEKDNTQVIDLPSCLLSPL